MIHVNKGKYLFVLTSMIVGTGNTSCSRSYLTERINKNNTGSIITNEYLEMISITSFLNMLIKLYDFTNLFSIV